MTIEKDKKEYPYIVKYYQIKKFIKFLTSAEELEELITEYQEGGFKYIIYKGKTYTPEAFKQERIYSLILKNPRVYLKQETA
jgi:hypothetical protein